MEVSLLGPVQASHDGAPVGLGGSANAAVLAILALATPRALTIGELTEGLWFHEPESVASVLHNRVARLRRAFQRAGVEGDAIATVGGGYRLSGPVATVDVHRVQDLNTRARKAEQRGDLAAAAVAWQEALGLWLGEPLSGLPDAPFVTAETARLSDLRFSLMESRFDVELRRGRHGESVGDLQAAVALAPLREVLWRQLMLALYRSGRTGDALAAFTAARRMLRDELGLDPSPETARLHEAILAGAPSLAVEARPQAERPSVAVASTPLTARTLPRPRTRFVGRQRDIVEVTNRVGSTGCLTVTGPGGVGKTRLALEVTSRVQANFPDGIVLTELAPVTEAGLVVDAVASAVVLLRSEHDERTPTEQLIDHLGGRTMLLVLDNCEHVLDAAADLAANLLSALPGLQVIATSREPLRIDGEVVWRLAPLAIPAASDAHDIDQLQTIAGVRLFLDRARMCRPELEVGASDAEVIAAIVRGLDGLPLALEIAAAALDRFDLTDLATTLADRFGVLVESRRGGHARQQTLYATVDWSYQLLNETQRRVFEQVGALAAEADLATITAVIGEPVEPTLNALVRRSLVVRTAGKVPGYLMLDTIRAFARSRLAERDGGYDGLYAWARDQARTALLAERSGDNSVFDRLDQVLPNLRAAMRAALDHGRTSVAAEIATSLRPYWFIRAREDEAETWFAEVLPADDNAPRDDREQAGEWAPVWFAAAELTHDPAIAMARLRRGLTLAEGHGERYLAGRVRVVIADHYIWREGSLEEAEALLDAADPLLRGGDDGFGVAFALEVRSGMRLKQGRLDESSELLHAAAAALPPVGYPITRYWITVGIAWPHVYQHDLAGARAEFAKALQIAESARYVAGQLYALNALAQMDISIGDVVAARAGLARIRELGELTGARAWEGWTRTLRSRVLLADADVSGAAELIDDSRARGAARNRPDHARRVSVLAAATGLLQEAADLLAHADADDDDVPFIGDPGLRRDIAWVRTREALPEPAADACAGDLTRHADEVLARVRHQAMVVDLPPTR